ncbi:MAG: hypothetical protein AAF328_11260 [Planctomycetota bacterium]
MALFGFGKKTEVPAGDAPNEDSPAVANAKKADPNRFKRDLRKARKFYEHAEVAADSKNFDYAIELYINGLRHDPDNMGKHEALLDAAKRRKVGGAKRVKAKKLGTEHIDLMCTAEKTWATDFTDADLAYQVMKYAALADAEEHNEEYHLGEVAHWIGSMAADFNAASKKPSKTLYLNIRDRFSEIGAHTKALEMHRRALALTPQDSKLLEQLKDLEALKYTEDRKESGGAMSNVKDAEEQAKIQAELDTSGSQVDKLIAARIAEYKESPDDLEVMDNLVKALLRAVDDEKRESQAVEVLERAHRKTGQYRYKTRASDVKMKQLNRAVRQYKQFVDAAPDSEEYREKYDAAIKAKADFELGEYQDRVKNYPTDLRLKFEFGRRLYTAGMLDEAIGMLQQATKEPKSRSAAHLMLGRAFMSKEWADEAINTLQEGFDQHEVKDDKIGKELRYDLMLAHMSRGVTKQDDTELETAQQHASALLQSDINYKDIRDQLEAIRGERKKLQDA